MYCMSVKSFTIKNKLHSFVIRNARKFQLYGDLLYIRNDFTKYGLGSWMEPFPGPVQLV